MWLDDMTETAYKSPLSFIPEQWYSRPDLIVDRRAFAPFSIGAQNCIGRNLAMMQLRTVTAALILTYDVRFAPGEDGSKLMDGTIDAFSVLVDDLELVFTARTT